MWKRPVPLHIPVRKISFAGRRFKYDVRTGKQAGQARVCRMINHASVTCVMQFHLVRVPVKLIFLAKPKFVLAVGCYAYRPDTASVAGTLEGYESILRYVCTTPAVFYIEASRQSIGSTHGKSWNNTLPGFHRTKSRCPRHLRRYSQGTAGSCVPHADWRQYCPC